MGWTNKMKSLSKAILILTISPLLIILFISTLNLYKPSKIRFLIWTTPTLNLGSWIALGSISSALITSAISISLTGDKQDFNRRVHTQANNQEEDINSNYNNSSNEIFNDHQLNDPIPERDIRETSPTVSVPFKVIRKGDNYFQRDDSEITDFDDTLDKDEDIDLNANQPRSLNLENENINTSTKTIDDWNNTYNDDW